MAETLEIRYLDSGQGDCIIMRLPDGKNVMIDCGSIKSSKVVLPEIIAAAKAVFLKWQLDILILTHADRDHYNLLRDFIFHTGLKPGEIYYGNSLTLYPERIQKLIKKSHSYGFKPNVYRIQIPRASGQQGNADWDLTILGVNVFGDPKKKNLTNQNSLACLLTCNGFKFFFMGDAFWGTEQKILNYYTNTGNIDELEPSGGGTATVLKMGHHGSPSSSGRQFIEVIQPSMVVATADMKRFGKGAGHPGMRHLNTLLNWSPRLKKENKPIPIKHRIVAYSLNKFVQKDESYSGRCTSMYQITPPLGGTWSVELIMTATSTEAHVGSTQ